MDISSLRSRHGPTTLRRTWAVTVLQFTGVIVAISVLALTATQRQNAMFSDTMGDLERETVAATALDRELLEATGLLTSVIYRGGTPEQREALAADYQVARADVNEAFDQVRSALHTDRERAVLDQAQRTWTEVDTTVLAAESAYTDAELVSLLTTGQDPFVATVWTPYDRLDRELTNLRTVMVDDLKQQVADAGNLGDALVPLILAVLALALGIAFVAARRMSRRVLEPLAEIGRRTERLTVDEVDPRLDVPGAVVEIRHLARTINDTAASLHLSNRLLQSQATTDSLTSLPNRAAFNDRLTRLLDDPTRGHIAVLFIDLDDFKDVNDTLGHAAGDKLLHIVGLRLEAATRSCELVARLGGDEFAVAADFGDVPEDAPALARRILDTLDEPVQVAGGIDIRVQCSVGIAVVEPGSDTTVSEVLGNADFAMYMAKGQGKNCFETHSASMHAEMVGRMELRRDLTHALERQQFELHYQPIVDLDSQTLLGFEALLRWRHPTQGLVGPDEFICLADDSGAIVDIGAWVLEECCAVLAHLHEHDPSLRMSINVAPRQLATPDFDRVVLNAALGHGVPPDQLVLEITEATAMTNTETGIGALERLREHGVHVALDDFGTGFSSLRYLSDLPADVIKIDRSFVVGHGPNETSMLDSIIALAKRLDLFVVAEGIEGPEDLERLRTYGDIAGQGFLLARPMPACDIDEYREHFPPMLSDSAAR